MPAQRPRAAFEPISPDFDINQLVEQTPNFLYVDRISCDQIDEQGVQAFEQLVLLHVIIKGKPLVVDGFESRLDPWTFTPRWLCDNVGSKVEQSRNLASKDYIPLSIAHYLNNMGKLANQYFENPRNYRDKTRQRIYLKDIDCPQVWHDKLQEQMPPSLFYLNESTGELGGPGATVDPNNTIQGRRLGRGIGRAGDLMSNLPPDMRAENLMCYIGHEGTYTPAHREMCATMGHNIMVEASSEVSQDGKPEKPGSSIWFMTESNDRQTVSEYWLSVLGHDIEVESHFAQVSAWKKAPFNVYVVEQKPGDFILIPPLAPHQVWNRGTRTMKVAWNRTTVETLEMAFSEALPKARIVCRDEQYKNKAIVYYTLIKYSGLLAIAKAQAEKLPPDAGRSLLHEPKIRQLTKDFKRLLGLYRDILLSEMFSLDGSQEKCEYIPFDSNVTCAYCRGNVFNRFLTCPSCKDYLGHAEAEPYDVCMDCYAMGRSCACISNLKWVEQFKWKELTQKYESWRRQAVDLDGGKVSSKTPLPLSEERRKRTSKTLAEVCKEQLKKRPFVDINKPKDHVEENESEEDIIVDDEGRVKKTIKKRSKTWLKTHSPCHTCCKRHPNWKSAKCTTCEKWWCYGSLFRGADMMPLDIMQDPGWSCPHCRKVCFAGNCRKDPKQTPYEPKGTLLGHDTKRIADARSVECLVDFSVSNLNWLRDDEDAEESARIRRAREDAQRAKEIDPQMDDDDDAEEGLEVTQVQFEYSPDATPSAKWQPNNNFALDPALQTEPDPVHSLVRAIKDLPPSTTSPGARTSSLLANGNTTSTLVPQGYAPATTGGYIAPTAEMHSANGGDGAYSYPDPENQTRMNEDGVESQAQRAAKRPRKSGGKDQIYMDPQPKKRRIVEDMTLNKPRNEATKQFEREKERKALDEAKKQGRFVAVQAALKGKKRVIRLKIPGPKLAQLLARQTASQVAHAATAATGSEEPEIPEETILLRSDVAPANQEIRKVGSSKMKIRVEKDEDFGVRRDRHQRTGTERRRNTAIDYEEVDVASDEDAEDLSFASHSASKIRGPAGNRRVSSYIQRKHQDDPDLPDELPENFKDSRAGRKRTRSRPQPRVSASANAQDLQTRDEIIIPANISDKSQEEEFSEVSRRQKMEEENRRAKLQVLSMVQDVEDSGSTSESASSTPYARVPVVDTGTDGSSTPAPAFPQALLRRSIFDSKGRKAKIVSVNSIKKSKLPPKGRAGRATMSDSDSDGIDVVPARASNGRQGLK